MRWLRRWRRKAREQARVDEAREDLERVREQWPAVRRAAAAVSAHRRDEFADQIRVAMGVKDR